MPIYLFSFLEIINMLIFTHICKDPLKIREANICLSVLTDYRLFRKHKLIKLNNKIDNYDLFLNRLFSFYF